MIRLSDQLVALATMSPAQLRAEWRRAYRTSPPALSTDLLARGIAYRLQEKYYGGLAAQAERELLQIAATPAGTGVAPRPDTSLRAGTKLVRSWRGETYAVSVIDDGFLFKGQRRSSLTAIAREITGAAWSGPRFFGLIKRGGSAHA